jgi:hypothetical protein
MDTLENHIDYFYDPKIGYSALLKVGVPPYPSVTGSASANEARAQVLQKAQDPRRREQSPKS